MKLPAAPLTERLAADATPGAPQAEAPPDALFAALLNLITARTAPAEGHPPDVPADVPAGAAPAQDAPKDAAEPKPAPAPVATPQPDALVAELPLPLPATAPPKAPAVHEQQPAVAAPAAPGTATPPTPSVPVGVAEPQPQPQHKDHPPHDHAVPATPAVPAQRADEPARKAPRPSDRATPATPARPAAARPQHADAQPSPQAAAPTMAAAAKEPVRDHAVTPHAAPEARPVLRAERIEALVRLATRQGAAEARMELHPQELGSVVVKLRVTADGLHATFTASNPGAVTQLQQAGDDLRRSLEAKGITLAGLDVRDSSGEAGERRERRSWDRGRGRRAVEQADDDLPTVTTSIPVGELVDVHA